MRPILTAIAVACLSCGLPAMAEEPSLGTMPEARGISVEGGAMASYQTLAAKLEPAARAWLAQSGLFLEDGRLDRMERSILRRIAGKRDQVWFLTAPRMLDGVGFMDMVYARLWTYRVSPYSKLIKELGDLAKSPESGVRAEAVPRFREMVARARHDPELQVGLALVGNLGQARSDRFQYPTPAYNTQLAMLGRLLGTARAPRADRATLAAAVVYGSLFGPSERALQKELPAYAGEMVDRACATGTLCEMASVASLEYLVWGAPGTAYPAFFGDDGLDSDGWYPRLRRKPMTLKQFRWTFASAALLDSIKSRVGSRGAGLLKMHDELESLTEEEAAKGVVRYRGERFRGSHVMNPEYYWERYSQGVTVTGDSLDKAQMEVLAARALGLPAVVGRVVVDQGSEDRCFAAIYDQSARGFRAYPDDLLVCRRSRGIQRIQVGFQKLPWDNFRFDTDATGSVTRILNLEVPEVRVLSEGIPAGYLLRGRNPELSVSIDSQTRPQV